VTCEARVLCLVTLHRKLLLLLVVPAEGIADAVPELEQLLNPAAGGVKGLLLHGMGGIGKSTLAHQVAVALQDKQLFPGGVFKVEVQPDMQERATEGLLKNAQCKLLQQLTDKQQQQMYSLEDGAAKLREALKELSKAGKAVLVLVDNVPEDSRGIRGLLPEVLVGCTAPG